MRLVKRNGRLRIGCGRHFESALPMPLSQLGKCGKLALRPIPALSLAQCYRPVCRGVS